MAKKSTNRRQRNTEPAFGGIQRKSADEEFNPDYSSVKKELRRIGTLASIFIILLVLVAIFQDQLLAIFIR